jgi:hypothetical protein
MGLIDATSAKLGKKVAFFLDPLVAKKGQYAIA